MTSSDAYVLPIAHDVVAARRRLFVIFTGCQVAVVVIVPVLALALRNLRAITSGYDLRVPWSRVSRIAATARGQRWNLVVHIDDTGGLAGDDPVKRAALRKMQGPSGAGLTYRIGYIAAALEELDEVVRRHSANERDLRGP